MHAHQSSSVLIPPSTTPPNMSLAAGPGIGGMATLPGELRLFVDKNVRYIQSLDTVRTS